jgi:hypothetical protein
VGTGDEVAKDFKKLPDTDNFRATLAQNPPTVVSGPIPRVLVSVKPAELIATQGEPDLVAIPGTTLSYVDDTDSDLFRLGNDWYYLVSGRWFTANNLSGPWSGVTKLPETFSQIPADHPRGDVRVAVPGTEEAKLATLEADIPRKAELKKTATPGIDVKYNGEPQFEQVGALPCSARPTRPTTCCASARCTTSATTLSGGSRLRRPDRGRSRPRCRTRSTRFRRAHRRTRART